MWSYGILMWEIFSLGSTPYSGLTNNQAREKVDEGKTSLLVAKLAILFTGIDTGQTLVGSGPVASCKRFC